MPYLLFLLICSIWGSSFILMKRATLGVSPFGISVGRAVFGALVLAMLFYIGRRQRTLRRADFWPLIGAIVTGFAWPYTVQPWLIAHHQKSAFIAMTVAFTPLLTLGLSTVLLGTRATARQITGVVGSLFFLLLLMWDGWQQNIPAWHLLMAISVPLTYAFGTIIIRRALPHVGSLELTMTCLMGSALVLMPLALTSSVPATATREVLPVAWGALILLGILGTGVATWWFNYLVVSQSPLFAAMVTNLTPLGAMAWGWADGETITPRQVGALCGVLCMVALVQVGNARRPVHQIIVPPSPTTGEEAG